MSAPSARDFPQSIVVIDDDDSTPEILKKCAEKMGVPVIHTFDDGRAGWDFLAQNTVEFVILDWKLPSVSGLALFNRLRTLTLFSDTPVMVVSGYLDPRSIRPTWRRLRRSRRADSFPGSRRSDPNSPPNQAQDRRRGDK